MTNDDGHSQNIKENDQVENLVSELSIVSNVCNDLSISTFDTNNENHDPAK